MKTYKAITVDGEMALKRLPEIKEPDFRNWHERRKWELHIAEIESEPIIKVAPFIRVVEGSWLEEKQNVYVMSEEELYRLLSETFNAGDDYASYSFGKTASEKPNLAKFIKDKLKTTTP